MVGELVEELVVDVLLHEHPRDEGEDEVVGGGRVVGGRVIAIGAGRRGQVEEDGGGEGLGGGEVGPLGQELLRRGGHGSPVVKIRALRGESACC